MTASTDLLCGDDGRQALGVGRLRNALCPSTASKSLVLISSDW